MTLQEFWIAWQAANVVGSVARDMARNSTYALTRPHSAERTAIAIENADQYLRLLNSVRNNSDADIQQAINSAIVAAGITDAAQKTDALITLATNYRNATRNNRTQADNADNAILAAIPKAITVY